MWLTDGNVVLWDIVVQLADRMEAIEATLRALQARLDERPAAGERNSVFQTMSELFLFSALPNRLCKPPLWQASLAGRTRDEARCQHHADVESMRDVWLLGQYPRVWLLAC